MRQVRQRQARMMFRRRARRARWTRQSGEPRPFVRWVLPVMLRDILADGHAAMGETMRRLGLTRADGDLLWFLLAVALGCGCALSALGYGATVAPAAVCFLGALGGLVFARRDVLGLWARWQARHERAPASVVREAEAVARQVEAERGLTEARAGGERTDTPR